MSSSQRIPRRVQAGYGAAEGGMAGAEFLLTFYLLIFGTEVLGLSPGMAALAIAVGTVWDAVSDPLMGMILDRAPFGRKGRYVPFMAMGAPLLAISFALLLQPLGIESSTFALAWFLSLNLFVNTGLTLLSVPHVAMVAHLSADRHERTSLYGWRLAWGNLGLLLGLLGPPVVARFLGVSFEEPEGRGPVLGVTGVIAAAGIMLTAIITILAVARRDTGEDANAPAITLSEQMGGFLAVLRNGVFRPLLLAFLAAAIARVINGATAFYYYETRLELTLERTVGAILLPFVLAILLSVPLWVWAGRRFGKKRPALIGMIALAVAGAIVYPLFPPGEVTGPFFMAIFGGVAAGAIILFESMVPDVVDHDEAHAGRSREGLYFGFWKLSTKLARAVGLALTGVVLEFIGYVEGAPTQAPGVDWRLALLFGPGVALGFLAAAGALAFYPLTSESHARAQEIIARRREKRTQRVASG